MINLVLQGALLLVSTAFWFVSGEGFSGREIGIMYIIPVLIAVAACAFMEYFRRKKFRLVVFFLCVALACFFPEIAVFLPLISYNTLSKSTFYMPLFILIPIIISPKPMHLFTAALAALVLALKLFADSYNDASGKLRLQRDDLYERTLSLRTSLEHLAEKQNYELHLAVLGERNRIAREIHDNVGHILSRSIIQIGAMQVTVSDEGEREQLKILEKSLSSGMDSIRKSVHDLYEDSVDLAAELNKLVGDFTFCKAKLSISCRSFPETSLCYAIAAIVKEALSNVMKHSDADSVMISLYEHPSFYQLTIKDNGNAGKPKRGGIGIEGMRQRVLSFDGRFYINNENGFRIFASFPKGKEVT